MADKGLKVFTDYKNKILEAFVSGDTPLVRAIANNDVDFMSKPVENPADLIYKQIFPYKWMGADIAPDKHTYVTLSFSVDQIEGGVFNEIIFAVFIIVHKDLMRVKYNNDTRLRTDFICEQIEDLFSRSTDFGVGRLELINMGETFVTAEYPAIFLTFRTTDFANR